MRLKSYRKDTCPLNVRCEVIHLGLYLFTAIHPVQSGLLKSPISTKLSSSPKTTENQNKQLVGNLGLCCSKIYLPTLNSRLTLSRHICTVRAGQELRLAMWPSHTHSGAYAQWLVLSTTNSLFKFFVCLHSFLLNIYN